MKKYLLLVVGALAAPFVGHKTTTPEKVLNRTAKQVKEASGGKTDIQIQPLHKILLAPQDVSDPSKDKGKGGKPRRTYS